MTELTIPEDQKLRCYYIGAIQYAWKKGVPWRIDVDKLLKPLGVEGFNPITIEERLFTHQFGEVLSFDKIATKRDGWKRSGRWDKFHKEHMWIIRVADLAYGVLTSDFVVLYWQIGIEKGGTLDELFCVAKCAIPIYVVVNQPISTMNDWVLDVLGQMEKENYPSHIREIMGKGLTRFAKIFRSFKALANHIAEHRDELLERKRILKENGILDLRRQLFPLFLFPGALLDYIWTTREQYFAWLNNRPEYKIDPEVDKKLQEIFKLDPLKIVSRRKRKIKRKGRK